MSTTASTTTADASQSASAPTSSSSSQSNSDTATLYLFTFLATILILVLLSASLVLRSYILRRRYRQRFQQALTDTLFIDLDRAAFNAAGHFDPLGMRRSARRFGPKPILWDAWIHPVNGDNWPSFTPVAVRCSPPSPLSTVVSSPQPSVPSPSPQDHPSLFSQLRFPSPFSLASCPSSPRHAHLPTGTPTPCSARSPPPPPPPPPGSTSPNVSIHTEKDAATLAVCVLVAMPDISAPVHRSVPDAKGKGVDPLESQAPQPSGDADPLLPSSPHHTGPRIPDYGPEDEGIPVLEFGVIEVETGDWVWT